MIDMEMKKVSLNGVNVTRFDSFAEIVEQVLSVKKVFVAINPEKIVNPKGWITKLVNENVGYVDGVGVLMGLWKKGVYQKRRLPGFKLWLEVIKTKPEAGYYLIGGTQEVIELTISQLKIDFPNINIRGYSDGYSYYEIIEEIKSELHELAPRVVLVAMGSPRQEKIIAHLFETYKASYIGLGGSFDYYIGKVQRTPEWIQRIGFQWLHRLIMQPKRFKRQMVLVKYFLNLVFKY